MADLYVFCNPFYLHHYDNKFVSSFEKKKICNQEMKKLKGKENGFENFESLINIQFLHVHKLKI